MECDRFKDKLNCNSHGRNCYWESRSNICLERRVVIGGVKYTFTPSGGGNRRRLLQQGAGGGDS